MCEAVRLNKPANEILVFITLSSKTNAQKKNQRKIVNIFLPIILANVVGAQENRLIKWHIAVRPMMP